MKFCPINPQNPESQKYKLTEKEGEDSVWVRVQPKNKANVKKKSVIKKKKLILPSLSDFEKLPLSKRQRLFERWVSTKRGEYSYRDMHACPLAQFGQAITRSDLATGCVTTFMPTGYHSRLDGRVQSIE